MLAAASLLGLSRLIEQPHWLLGSACVVGALVYLTLLYTLAPNTVREFKSTMRG